MIKLTIEEELNLAQEYYDNHQYKEAYDIFIKYANIGNGSAQNAIGVLYGEDNGYGIDLNKSFRYFTLSAENGNKYGECNLAFFYYLGYVVKKDYNEAYRLFKLSADQGVAISQCYLGFMYLNGLVINTDDGIKVLNENELSDPNNLFLQRIISGIYSLNMGCEEDYKEAFRLFKLSADQGYDLAECALGVMYYCGIGTQKNYEKAEKFLRLAESHGCIEAHDLLNNMYGGSIEIPDTQIKLNLE